MLFRLEIWASSHSQCSFISSMSRSPSLPPSKHFKQTLASLISTERFWFPLQPVPPAFSRAFRDASLEEIPPKAKENRFFHTCFVRAWKESFPNTAACPTHYAGMGCAATCTQPVLHHCADSPPIGFDNIKPDFLHFRSMSAELNARECDGVVEMTLERPR